MSFSAGSRVGSRTSLHVKFDKYLELTIGSGERIRHAGGVECIDLNEISAEIQTPKRLKKIWTSPANKTNLQQRGSVWFLQHQWPPSRIFSRVHPSQPKEGIVPAQFLRVFHKDSRTKYIGW